MTERTARAVWEGTLIEGHGQIVETTSKALPELPVTWASRTEAPSGRTSPEELLAAAHAACYAMALSNTLAEAGTPAERLEVAATCAFNPVGAGWKVTSMDLAVTGTVAGIDQADFDQLARKGEQGCPISNAIRGNVEIRLTAELSG